MLGDAGCFFNNGTMLGGTGVEDRAYLALPNQYMLAAADSPVRQQLMEIHQTTRCTVQLVLGAAVAEKAASHPDFVERNRQELVRVVKGDRYFGATQGRTCRRSGKDHVFHLLGAERPSCLGSHHPGEGIKEVRFARAVWPHNHVDPCLEIEAGSVRKGLESSER